MLSPANSSDTLTAGYSSGTYNNSERGPGRGAGRGMLSVERDGSQGEFSVEDQLFKVPPRPPSKAQHGPL